MRRPIALALAWAVASCSVLPLPKPAAADFNQALAPVFERDMPNALARLATLPESALTTQHRAVRSCMQDRFGSGEAGATPLASLADKVLASYRRYWTASLLRQQPYEQAESILLAELDRLSGAATGSNLDTRHDATDRVASLLEAQGLFVLGGVTPPLRELMLWRQQTSTSTRVDLPDGPVNIKVTMLDDFQSLGWAAWATCDRSHTGGWVTPQGMMVVRAAWDLDSEAYRVSLLAHEAQHFSDIRRYPRLSSADLEYRAKLVELALSLETQATLMQSFVVQARRDKSLPHAFASYWLVERLQTRLGRLAWTKQPPSAVRQAALAELAAHSNLLNDQGPEWAITALPD